MEEALAEVGPERDLASAMLRGCIEGNCRFLAGRQAGCLNDARRRAELAEAQFPGAVRRGGAEVEGRCPEAGGGPALPPRRLACWLAAAAVHLRRAGVLCLTPRCLSAGAGGGGLL